MAIQEIAVLAPWYKGILTDNTIPGLSKGTKVWFKLNTEKPLSSGPTYWVFDANSRTLRHISEAIGNELLQGVRAEKGMWSIATEEQTRVLTQRFKPLVTKLVNSPSWKNVGKPRTDTPNLRPKNLYQQSR